MILVLLGGLWWLTRPKIDPRFVGEWKYRFSRSEALQYADVNDVVATLKLGPDGSGDRQSVAPFGSWEKPVPLNWWIDRGSRLVLKDQMNIIDTVQDHVTVLVAAFSGSKRSLQDRWTIQSSTDRRIVLQNAFDPASFMVLERDAQ